jgi:hypothetical protein
MKNGKGAMAATEPKEQKSKAQRVKEYRQKAEQLAQEARDEQLEIINAAIGELKDLGYVYHILTAEAYSGLQSAKTAPGKAKQAGSGKSTTPAASGPSANYNGDKFCEVCQIKSHDGRAHRTHKEAFTQPELAERGLLPPAA